MSTNHVFLTDTLEYECGDYSSCHYQLDNLNKHNEDESDEFFLLSVDIPEEYDSFLHCI